MRLRKTKRNSVDENDEDKKEMDTKTKQVKGKKVLNEELNKTKPIWTRKSLLGNVAHSGVSLTIGKVTSLSSTSRSKITANSNPLQSCTLSADPAISSS